MKKQNLLVIFLESLKGRSQAGPGITMSLFVTDLAFKTEELRFYAKLSILFTSALAGILGSILLWVYSSPQAKNRSINNDME